MTFLCNYLLFLFGFSFFTLLYVIVLCILFLYLFVNKLFISFLSIQKSVKNKALQTSFYFYIIHDEFLFCAENLIHITKEGERK